MIQIFGSCRANSFSTVTNGWYEGLSYLTTPLRPHLSPCMWSKEYTARRVAAVLEGGRRNSYGDNYFDRGYPELRLMAWDFNSLLDQEGLACVVTDPTMMRVSRAFRYKKRLLVIAPHSEMIPEGLAEDIERSECILCPPSEFCAEILRKRFPSNRCVLVEHGVSKDFRPLTTDERVDLCKSNLIHLRGPGMNLLHFSEGSIERKGTDVLIEAFDKFIESGNSATLTCIASGMNAVAVNQLASGRACANHVKVLPRADASPTHLKWLFNVFDYVVQPSRVEGFGLIPLEALCCGVPVIVTGGTGHAQWLKPCRRYRRAFTLEHGVIEIPLSDPTPMLSEAGALCPSVSVDDVLAGLFRAGQEHIESSINRTLFFWEEAIVRANAHKLLEEP